ncbi:phage tail protein [Actinomadura rubrisoli]|uniref:Phage tail protein n=1 Tax=Actinomadura rubrisoli TaxID=2530368 RepID=A0A4R5CJR6_9ACTN|nr:phage tail protein [Actinomadura rubrisoli]TDD97644.1 phage tail protein [Actinomadura rubrisoli]
MAGSAYDDIQQRNAALIFKALQGSVFTAPSTAAAITNLTDSGDKLLKALPTGYEDVGWTSDDGAQFGRDVDTSDITGWGSVEPLRSDVNSDVTTLQIACLETKKATIGLYTGADMAAATPDPVSGELSIEKPARPSFRYYRVIAIAVDLTDDGEYYVARFLPRARVTDFDEQAMQSSDDSPLTWAVTLTSYQDATLGYSERYIFGGPGWATRLASMGFDALAS